VSIYDSFNGGQQSGDGQVTLDSTGNAEWNNRAFQAGTHAITAYYSGDWSYNSSTSSTVNFGIAPAAAAISLSSDVSSIFSGSANLHASVSAALPPLFSMYGTVTFNDTTNNTVLGTSPLIGGCQGAVTQCDLAVFNVNVDQLAMGANQITASYSGDSNFTPAGPSVPITLTCTAGCSNGTGQTLSLAFNVSIPFGPLSAGMSSTTLVDVAGGGGFTGAVNMTCSVTGSKATDIHLPTCSFNPAQITIGGTGGGQSTLTLKTTAPTSSSVIHARSSWKPGSVVLALLVLFTLPRRRKRGMGRWMGVLLLVATAGWISACGGSGSSASPPVGGGIPGTTADVYTVTFRAADAATGTVTAQDAFRVTVQ
jgi:hypothetical protein